MAWMRQWLSHCSTDRQRAPVKRRSTSRTHRVVPGLHDADLGVCKRDAVRRFLARCVVDTNRAPKQEPLAVVVVARDRCAVSVSTQVV